MTSLLLSTLKILQRIVDGIFTIVRSTPAFFAPSPNSLRTISPSGDLSFSTHKNAHRLLLSKQPARAFHKSIRTFFLCKHRQISNGRKRKSPPPLPHEKNPRGIHYPRREENKREKRRGGELVERTTNWRASY
jgi:hypothetical protein